MKKKLLCFKWAFHSCIATPRNTCLCSPKQLFNGKWRLYGSSMLYLQTGTESDMSMLVHVCNEQLFLSVQMCFVKKQTSKNIIQCTCNKPRNYSPPTFVVEEALHLHGGPGVSDAEHGAGHNALLGWRAIRGPDQAPVRLVVQSLQNLNSLAAADCQLPVASAVTGHKVVYDHCEFTATRELEGKQQYSECFFKRITSILIGVRLVCRKISKQSIIASLCSLRIYINISE